MSDSRSREPNFPNRTLAVMDNLEFLRALDNDCIDLIAIDPPFAANETFTGKPKHRITEAERGEERALAARHGRAALDRYAKEDKQLTSVKDDWFWRDIDEAWMKALKDAGERVRVWEERREAGENLDTGEAPSARDRTLDAMREVIEAVSACATENEAAYIALMSVRLIECHRVLKDTGSIYVHCDWHANSYLRMLMDAIFGYDNLRNEIVWGYAPSGRAPKYGFHRKHDCILYYSKTDSPHFFHQHTDMLPETLNTYNKTDEDGRQYKESPGGRSYLDEQKGRPVPSWWTDIPSFGAATNSPERTGYALQKPLALYRRIIRASSNPGDVVLDLFAGCATTVVAAELEGRNWIACDWAYRASTMMMRRFYKEAGIVLSNMNVDVVHEAIGPTQGKLEYKNGLTIGPPDLARFPRQTEDPDDGVPTLKTSTRAPISTSWTGRIPKDRAKEMLLAEFGPVCWGCGLDATRPNGSVDTGLLEVDHIRARNAKEGARGDDELYNLALLHATCNRRKGNRLTLEELRLENEQDDVLNVSSRLDLVDLFEAQQFAHRMLANYGQDSSIQ